MNNLRSITKEEILNLTSIREGETKLGEELIADFAHPDAKFVVLGIPEDIGPQANFGLPGAKNLWQAFLKSFVNIQSNKYNHSKIAIAGEVDTRFLYKNPTTDIIQLREKTDQLDEVVYPIIQKLIELDKVPIVIGGGHNNAYPLLKGTSLALSHSVNAINIDPHADLRPMKGRNSGNGFSYAFNEGYLHYYHVLGLHENYNSAYILQQFEEHKNLSFTTYENFLRGEYTLPDMAILAIQKTAPPLALEIDLDSIAYMPSSAISPSGFSLDQVRSVLQLITHQNQPLYLHISEGAPQTPHEEKLTGKAVAYLVSDFIKSYAYSV